MTRVGTLIWICPATSSIQYLKLTINSVADSATLVQDCVKVWREKSTTVPHKFHVSWPLCIEFLDPLMYFLLSIQGVNIKKSLKLGKQYLVNSRWSSEVCILSQISIKIRSETNAINSWMKSSFPADSWCEEVNDFSFSA